MLNTIAGDTFARRKKAGIFTPEYKQLSEPYDALRTMLEPIKLRSNKNEGIIRTRRASAAALDFWTLNDNDLAGRGREYHEVLGDEMAFTKPNMREIWEKAIEPTMLTTDGIAWLFSTPFGIDENNFFYQACHDEKLNFVQYHAPTASNPYVPPEAIEKYRRNSHPLVFRQEYLAEFVDWSGVAFFSLQSLLDENGEPPELPTVCDAVFAVIDTAIKTGTDNDGTGVTYFATSRHGGPPLQILDWDLLQIEGSLLEAWLPSVYLRLEHLARQCGARMGSLGAFIEDKGSGTILLQQAARREWAANAIDSKLTAVGKDERALSVSGYVYRGMVKICRPAFEKVSVFKGVSRNHWLAQVTGFRLGDKDAAKRADDLLDTFCYGVAITLGDSEGY